MLLSILTYTESAHLSRVKMKLNIWYVLLHMYISVQAKVLFVVFIFLSECGKCNLPLTRCIELHALQSLNSSLQILICCLGFNLTSVMKGTNSMTALVLCSLSLDVFPGPTGLLVSYCSRFDVWINSRRKIYFVSCCIGTWPHSCVIYSFMWFCNRKAFSLKHWLSAWLVCCVGCSSFFISSFSLSL